MTRDGIRKLTLNDKNYNEKNGFGNSVWKTILAKGYEHNIFKLIHTNNKISIYKLIDQDLLNLIHIDDQKQYSQCIDFIENSPHQDTVQDTVRDTSRDVEQKDRRTEETMNIRKEEKKNIRESETESSTSSQNFSSTTLKEKTVKPSVTKGEQSISSPDEVVTGGRPAKIDRSTEDSPVHPYMVKGWKTQAKDNTDIILRMLVNISESNGVRLSDTDIDGLIDNTFRQWGRLEQLFYKIQQDKHLNESQKQILLEHLYDGIKNQKLDDGYKRKIKHHLMRYFNIKLDSDEYDLGNRKPVPDSTSKFDLPNISQEVPEIMESFDDYFN